MVARCNIHLDICLKILSLKWFRFGLITVGSSKTLFLCYAAVTPIPAKSLQESIRRRFKKRRVEISFTIVTKAKVVFTRGNKTSVWLVVETASRQPCNNGCFFFPPLLKRPVKSVLKLLVLNPQSDAYFKWGHTTAINVHVVASSVNPVCSIAANGSDGKYLHVEVLP